MDQQQQKREQDERLKRRMKDIKHKIMVMSGKGGVGKSTIAANIASMLAMKEKQIGLLDVDIHGPNIPKMLGIEKYRFIGSQEEIEPVEVLPNFKVASIALAGYEPDSAFIWRGPLKMGVIRQFLADVAWGELDYLIIDSPPGTGDEPLSVCQLIPDIDGTVIVTTPQDVAVLDSRKSVSFSRKVEVPIIGIIENMSGFICPHCGNNINIFGSGGGEKAAKEMGVPFLGRIPLEPRLVTASDKGVPLRPNDTERAISEELDTVIQAIIEQVEK